MALETWETISKSKSFGGFLLVAQWWWLREARWRKNS